jgi:hypothetical protein
MRQTIIDIGERVTGVPVPVSVADLTEELEQCPFTNISRVEALAPGVRARRREWWLDVANVGFTDFVQVVTGTYQGRIKQPEFRAQSQESLGLAGELADRHAELLRDQMLTEQV